MILSSNVIWNAYRLIAETKIFRLGGSLICLYMLRKNRLAKKYNTERYIRTFRHTYNKWSVLIIQYKSTLNLHLLYLLTFTVFTYNLILCFFVYCNIVATHSYDGRTGFTFIWSFPAGFTSKNGLHNCEHGPSYQ